MIQKPERDVVVGGIQICIGDLGFLVYAYGSSSGDLGQVSATEFVRGGC